MSENSQITKENTPLGGHVYTAIVAVKFAVVAPICIIISLEFKLHLFEKSAIFYILKF
jgi:hypothetical protein